MTLLSIDRPNRKAKSHERISVVGISGMAGVRGDFFSQLNVASASKAAK
jgi:hypothetical protein